MAVSVVDGCDSAVSLAVSIVLSAAVSVLGNEVVASSVPEDIFEVIGLSANMFDSSVLLFLYTSWT